MLRMTHQSIHPHLVAVTSLACSSPAIPATLDLARGLIEVYGDLRDMRSLLKAIRVSGRADDVLRDKGVRRAMERRLRRVPRGQVAECLEAVVGESSSSEGEEGSTLLRVLAENLPIAASNAGEVGEAVAGMEGGDVEGRAGVEEVRECAQLASRSSSTRLIRI